MFSRANFFVTQGDDGDYGPMGPPGKQVSLSNAQHLQRLL